MDMKYERMSNASAHIVEFTDSVSITHTAVNRDDSPWHSLARRGTFHPTASEISN